MIEETGKPRIPKTIPVPEPVEVPVKEPAKKEEEKVPVPIKSQPIYDVLAEQAYTEVERTIQRLSKFLGISEQRVANLLLEAYAHVERILGGRKVDGAVHNPDTCTECYNPTP